MLPGGISYGHRSIKSYVPSLSLLLPETTTRTNSQKFQPDELNKCFPFRLTNQNQQIKEKMFQR